jgi:hypothetical protein
VPSDLQGAQQHRWWFLASLQALSARLRSYKPIAALLYCQVLSQHRCYRWLQRMTKQP